jgi:Tfp pilus assembly protein PilW
MKLKLYLHNCAKRFSRLHTRHSEERGQSMVELLVSASIGMAISGLMLTTTMATQRLYQVDIIQTRLEQNLRGAMDMIGMDAREAGENLPEGFPA